MNKVILMGRLTKDPDVRYTQGDNPMAIARYTLAVDRRYARKDRQDNQTADFVNIIAFGKSGEFAEKLLKKGTKIIVTGRIQTGSYANRSGQTVYTTEVVAEDQEFAESKNSANSANSENNIKNTSAAPDPSNLGEEFMDIPDGFDEELPFN